MDQERSGVPCFSLYQVGGESSKACYQSGKATILSALHGPYFDRKKISLQPVFNCSIGGRADPWGKSCSMSRKLSEILKVMVVSEKYLRMNFDVTFQIVEGQEEPDIFCALVNLLSFSLILAGVEIRSTFSCARAWLADDRISWAPPHQASSPKSMTMVMESAAKQIVHCELQGEFLFLNFQRLTNVLMDANEEFQNYMIRKIGAINDEQQEKEEEKEQQQQQQHS